MCKRYSTLLLGLEHFRVLAFVGEGSWKQPSMNNVGQLYSFSEVSLSSARKLTAGYKSNRHLEFQVSAVQSSM